MEGLKVAFPYSLVTLSKVSELESHKGLSLGARAFQLSWFNTNRMRREILSSPRSKEELSQDTYLYPHHQLHHLNLSSQQETKLTATLIAQHALSFPVSSCSPVFSSSILLLLGV